ncbi:hypothetical protein PF008_g7130 [Phytophthora fragariae]|uniref:Uncharacterized protein n=1 Tax=Phytophthora fragariae TaxID=53985 RepID=A0A6G0S3D6_9STRA|nr:hypothetical protein PF008_g7130 [Phytophthora fragariae]
MGCMIDPNASINFRQKPARSKNRFTSTASRGRGNSDTADTSRWTSQPPSTLNSCLRYYKAVVAKTHFFNFKVCEPGGRESFQDRRQLYDVVLNAPFGVDHDIV